MQSRALVVSLALTAALASLASAATVDREQVTARVRAVVKGYTDVVKELDLSRIPGNIPDYPAISDRLDEMGAELEGLSRLAGRENLSEDDWRKLDEQSAKAEADLKYLRCQSLPLRVWAYGDANGREKPEWGLAVDKTLCPLTRYKGTFDATATDELSLQGAPGDEKFAQIIVVPLARDLREMAVSHKDLAGPAGQLAAAQVKVEPLDFTRMPETPPTEPEWWRGRLLLTKPSIPRDLTQAYLLSVKIPTGQKPGKYSGRIYFSPANSKATALKVTVEVTGGASEVTK